MFALLRYLLPVDFVAHVNRLHCAGILYLASLNCQRIDAVGFGLGATPTAIANMTAVTKRYGPSPMAFVILPLVSAFFVDIVNSFAIQFFLPL